MILPSIKLTSPNCTDVSFTIYKAHCPLPMKVQRVILGYKSGEKKTVRREGLEPIKEITLCTKVQSFAY